MKKESAAINRFTNIQSEVGCHYLIKNNGEIITMVSDLYAAWHAGKSSWKNYKSLNKNSIGIEISNPGHEFNYKNFSNKQVSSILKLSKFLIKKYSIQSKNILGHSDIAPDRKKDPGEKFPWKYLAKNKVGIWHDNKPNFLRKYRKTKVLNKQDKKRFVKNLKKIGYCFSAKNKSFFIKTIKAFQRHFRKELINGILDQECFIIAQNLVKKL